MGLERLDGEEAELPRIREALESLPFLASKKLVVLRKPSANKQFIEQAEALLSEVSEITDVLIIEPKLDKRLAYYKYLKKATNFQEFNELDERGMAEWLSAQAVAAGGKLSATDARVLIDRVGLNQQMLSSEIDKLVSYNPQITRESIELLTEKTPQSTIFELIDAAMNGRTKQALTLYNEQRRMKVEPQQILAMFIWQLHILALVKTAGERSPDEIARQAKVSPYTVKKTVGIARRLSGPKLKQLVHDTYLLDIGLKSKPIDADEALQHLILSLGDL